MVSRLVYRKGVDLLVGIIPSICHELPDVDFIVGGDGTKRLALQEMVERERLQDRVEFLGSVPHINVRDVLCRGHVFLNCSLTESFCIAILEAACCGLLVVSTNVGGVPEVLPNDMVLLSHPTVSGLVGKLRTAIERQAKIPVDPFDFHRRVDGMYSWGRVAEETARVYDKVWKAKRRTFLERMERFQSLGGIAGLVACLLLVTFELLLTVVEWCQPEELIDRVHEPLIVPSEDETTD